MIKMLVHTEVVGWEAAIRGMRNPMNSWEKSDSGFGCENGLCKNCGMNPFYDRCGEEGTNYVIGPNDHTLMMKLAKGGPVHAKYRRMIEVYCDITAPLYWWKEFDTYKIGTVANSCSTMHKIHEKEFTLEDFSCEHLLTLDDPGAGFDYSCVVRNPENKNELMTGECVAASFECLKLTIDVLNTYRHRFLKTKDKKYWWQMIQLLPSSYNQKRTVMLNYETLSNIYESRRDHKLDEWRTLCEWIETLPYSEIITLKEEA